MPKAIWDTWWYLRYLPGAGSMALDLWEQESEWDTYAQATEFYIYFVGSCWVLVLDSSSFCTNES